MRTIRLAIVAAAALATLGLMPTAQAGPPPPTSFTVHDSQASEYIRDCTTSAPSHCNVALSSSLYIGFTVNNRPKQNGQYFPITVNYQIINGTAVAGQDFTVATSGSVTITPNNQNINLAVPIVNDGVAEPTETFTVRITSTSVPGDISDTGTGTIIDGDQFPDDCTLTQNLDASTRSLTCTGRPAAQRWLIVQPWLGWGYEHEYGNMVTGNGTSTASWVMNPAAPHMMVLS
jgi:hypothetical protein